ncbi:dcl1 [Symbiodinium natans]|uniref:Dcl1 protein n=1 Tax=Symbiodinium natans TaxID=878477 RepID=A0A812VBI2_9DINO|nr:dcl1 [Symbiodinium natans]
MPPKRCLVLVKESAMAEALAHIVSLDLCVAGCQQAAVAVSGRGRMPSQRRRDVLHQFRNGAHAVLVSTDCNDLPECQLLIHLDESRTKQLGLSMAPYPEPFD